MTDDVPVIGVEAFDRGYGAAYQVDAESLYAQACEVVEDGDSLECAPRRWAWGALRRVAFVDGVRRVDACLTATAGGRVCAGIAGAHGVGAVLAELDGPVRIERLAVTRLVLRSDVSGMRCLALADGLSDRAGARGMWL